MNKSQIDAVILAVAEIPDRDSPEDQPEMMLVTDKELRRILEKHAEELDPVDLTAENWAPVFHAAFRHSGFSNASSDAHAAIERMSNAEWLGIVDYMLIGIRRKLA